MVFIGIIFFCSWMSREVAQRSTSNAGFFFQTKQWLVYPLVIIRGNFYDLVVELTV